MNLGHNTPQFLAKNKNKDKTPKHDHIQRDQYQSIRLDCRALQTDRLISKNTLEEESKS